MLPGDHLCQLNDDERVFDIGNWLSSPHQQCYSTDAGPAVLPDRPRSRQYRKSHDLRIKRRRDLTEYNLADRGKRSGTTT